MALAATIEGDRHAAQNEGPRFHQSMRVVTNTDAQHTEKQTLSFVLCTLPFVLVLCIWRFGLQALTALRREVQSQISEFKFQSAKHKVKGFSATLPPVPDLPVW